MLFASNVAIMQLHELIIFIIQVADSAIMECPLEVDLKGKDFLEPDKDKTSWGRKVVS